MKSKYIFIHCEKELEPNTIIYTVMLGNSARDEHAKKRLEQLAHSSNFYFKPYSLNVCNYLQKVHECFSEKPWWEDDVPPRKIISAKELLQLIRRNFVDSVCETAEAIYQREQLSVEFYCKRHLHHGK